MDTNEHEWGRHGFHGLTRIDSVNIREIRVLDSAGLIRVYSCPFVVETNRCG